MNNFHHRRGCYRYFLLVTSLALLGVICQSRVVLCSYMPREVGGRSQDLQLMTRPSPYGGALSGRVQSGDPMLPLTSSMPSADRMQLQDVVKQPRARDYLSQQPTLQEIPRTQQFYAGQPPRTQSSPAPNQLRTSSFRPEYRPYQDHIRQDVHGGAPSTPQLQLDQNASREALDAYLEDRLAQMGREGAMTGRDRMNRLEGDINDRSRRAKRDQQDANPLRRDIVRRDRVEQQIRNAALAGRARLDGRNHLRDEQEQMPRAHWEGDNEVMEQQRLDRQRLDQRLRDMEYMEMDRLSREGEMERAQQNLAAEKAREEVQRLDRDVQEQAYHKMQKMEMEKLQRERLERYIKEHILKETGREQQSPTLSSTYRDTQEQAFREEGKVGNSREGTMGAKNTESTPEEQDPQRLQKYAFVETEMLEEAANVINKLRNYAVEQNQNVQEVEREPMRGDERKKPISQATSEEGIPQDTDHLWDSFQTFLRLSHQEEQQRKTQPQTREGVGIPQEPLMLPASEQQGRMQYQDPPAYQQESLVSLPGTQRPVNGYSRAYPPSPFVPAGTVIARTPIPPTEFQIPPRMPPVANVVSVPTSGLRSYGNSSNTGSPLFNATGRLLTHAEARGQEEEAFTNAIVTGFTEGKIDKVAPYESVGGTKGNDEALSGLATDILMPAPSPVSTSDPPSKQFKGSPEVVKASISERSNSSDHLERLRFPDITQYSMAGMKTSGEVSPGSVDIQTGHALSFTLRGRRLAAAKGASMKRDEGIARAEVQGLENAVHMSKWLNKSAEFSGDISQGMSDFATKNTEDPEDAEVMKNAESSALRALAGIRKRTRYGQSTSESEDIEESAENEFPVVELHTSSARTPPSGPQQPWSGAQQAWMSGGRRSYTSQARASDGSDYPNTPYRTYMYYPDPFSSPYSTHSFHEDYGEPYTNRYYHDTSPRTIISWREYIRRKEEKKAMEQRRSQEAQEPTVGVIKTGEEQSVGVLPQTSSRGTSRRSVTSTGLPRASSSQTTSQPATRLSRPTTGTRVSFTPYSSISVARDAGTATLQRQS